ncbi:MAG TPA: hypothetical protein VF026_20960 [Ktedonobacteraceae bacterium]
MKPLKVALITLLVIVIGLVGTIVLYDGTIGGTCTIGITGYAANITLSGFNAAASCGKVIARNPNQLYRVTDSPTGTELCEGQLQNGQMYTVRDTGTFMLIGNVLCKEIQNGTFNLTG